MLKELLEEIKNNDYKILTYNKWEVYYSSHSIDRDLERVNLSPDEFEKLLKKTIIFFDTCGKCINSEYLIYSREKEQGFIIDMFKDKEKFKVITILPPKRQLISNRTSWKTQKIFLEEFDNFYNKDLMEYAILNNNIFRIDEANKWISCDFPILVLEDEKIF